MGFIECPDGSVNRRTDVDYNSGGLFLALTRGAKNLYAIGCLKFHMNV